jgi:hypothetical protein
LLLDSEPDEVSRRIGESLAAVANRIDRFDSDKALLNRLLAPMAGVALVIIRVRDKAHLMQLTIHSMFLRGMHVAVVLPEIEYEMYSITHIFHPTLVMCIDDDFGKIAAMAGELIESGCEERSAVDARHCWGA